MAIFNKLVLSRAKTKAVNQIVIEAVQIQSLLSEKGDSLKSLIIDPQNTPELDRKKKADENFSAAYRRMGDLARQTELEESLKKIDDLISPALNPLETDIMADILANRKDEANFKYIIQYFPLRRGVDKMVEEFLAQAQKFAEDSQETIHTDNLRVARMVLGVQVTGIAIFLLLLWRVGGNIVNRLQSFSSQLIAAANNIRDRSKFQLRSAQELSSEMKTASSELQTTTSATEEINATVERNVSLAEHSKTLSAQGRRNVILGQEAVEQLLTSIKNVQNNNTAMSQQLETSFNDLEKIITLFQAVSEKTKTINEIVLQTRLLSFNASVEASRAGEHGKGFAIVAGEVGKLAHMSGSASKEIDTLLEDSRNQVGTVIDQIRNRIVEISFASMERVEESTRMAENCRQTFTAILDDVSQIDERIRDIHNHSLTQASGVRDITNSVRSVDTAIRKNTSRAEEGESKTREIEGQSEILDHVVVNMEKLISGGSKAA